MPMPPMWARVLATLSSSSPSSPASALGVLLAAAVLLPWVWDADGAGVAVGTSVSVTVTSALPPVTSAQNCWPWGRTSSG